MSDTAHVVSRAAICHTDRPYYAKGFCLSCYNSQYKLVHYKNRPQCTPEEYRLKRQNRIERGLCVMCGLPKNNITYKHLCISCAKWSLKRVKGRDAKDRRTVFTHYGLKCQCCGEDDYFSLTIDHINNDGKEHRKTVNARRLYAWLIKNNFPPGFQALCCNCNFLKYRRAEGRNPPWRAGKYAKVSYEDYSI